MHFQLFYNAYYDTSSFITEHVKFLSLQIVRLNKEWYGSGPRSAKPTTLSLTDAVCSRCLVKSKRTAAQSTNTQMLSQLPLFIAH